MPAPSTPPAVHRRKRPPRVLAENPRTWLVVARDGSRLDEHLTALEDLGRARHAVRTAFVRGPVPEGVPGGKHRLLTQRRVGPLPTASLSRALGALVPAGRRVRLAGYDRWLRRVGPQADEVLLVDQGPGTELHRLLQQLAPQARIWLPDEVAGVLATEAAWRRVPHEAAALDARSDREHKALSRIFVPAEVLMGRGPAVTDAVSTAFGPTLDARPELRRLARWAVRGGRLRDAQELLDLAGLIARRLPGSPQEDAPLAALQAHLDLVHGSTPHPEVTRLVSDVLSGADEALARDDLGEAAELGSVAMALLFHQQLHAMTGSTPLVTEPERFLAGLRESRLGQLMARSPEVAADATSGAGTPLDGPEDAPPPDAAPRSLRVTMMPGIYSNHAAPLMEALSEDPRVELSVLRPRGRAFGGLMMDTGILRHRLEHASGQEPTVDLGVTEEDEQLLREADVVVADWADKGCVWASTVVRRETRFIVRVHSADALSAPAHLVNWDAVDDLVFVSEHIKEVFDDILGERLGHVRQHVVTNYVPLEKFDAPLHADAGRTVGVVGWAQVVKDPLFALDVLEILVARDPSWRLRLVGADFGPHHAAQAREYAEQFRRRALSPQVVDNIDYTGFTRDLPEHLRHVGFILSCSLRESCPVGALEGTAAGAVPVVREWPAFARHQGARRLFPAEHVVITPAEAADLILSLADETDRSAAADRVRTSMSAPFSQEQTIGRLLDLVLAGSPATVAP